MYPYKHFSIVQFLLSNFQGDTSFLTLLRTIGEHFTSIKRNLQPTFLLPFLIILLLPAMDLAILLKAAQYVERMDLGESASTVLSLYLNNVAFVSQQHCLCISTTLLLYLNNVVCISPMLFLYLKNVFFVSKQRCLCISTMLSAVQCFQI